MRSYRIRFNLGRGKNYLKWKIEGPGGTSYYEPSQVKLAMHNCKLKNNKKMADRIYHGASKRVCAWILCTDVEVIDADANVACEGWNIHYNPKKSNHWFDNNLDDLDGTFWKTLTTEGRSILGCR